VALGRNVDEAGSNHHVSLHVDEIGAVEVHASGRRLDQLTDRLEHRALPRSVGSDDRHDFAATNGEVHVVNHVLAQVAGAQTRHVE